VRHCLAFITAIAMASPAVALDQAMSLPDVKAAFLVNFAKFVEWPATAADGRVTVCVAGDERVAASLKAATHAASPDSRVVAVRVLAPEDSPRSCHIVFVGVDNRRRVLALLDSREAVPILTVGDSEGFAQTGGMIELFLERGRMRFAVNVDAVERSRLRLSSRLLGLAKIVKDANAR
jgi:hypothetical protein